MEPTRESPGAMESEIELGSYATRAHRGWQSKQGAKRSSQSQRLATQRNRLRLPALLPSTGRVDTRLWIIVLSSRTTPTPVAHPPRFPRARRNPRHRHAVPLRKRGHRGRKRERNHCNAHPRQPQVSPGRTSYSGATFVQGRRPWIFNGDPNRSSSTHPKCNGSTSGAC